MKFNKYIILIGCLVLLLSISIVCAHDSTYPNSICQNNVNSNNIQDVTSCNVTDCNSTDSLGYMFIHVFADYNNTTGKFSNPVKGAKCYIYGWNGYKLVDSDITNHVGFACLKGHCLSRYHLEVKYPNGTVVKCDISKSKDTVIVSPTHCQVRTGDPYPAG